MVDRHDEPTLDDVMDPVEPTTPHRREHAKASPRPDDEELEQKTRVEQAEVGLGDRSDEVDELNSEEG